MNKKRKEIIQGNEISGIVTYSLGGYQQKVLIEGKSAQAPIMLFLHGGPGSPIPFSEGCRGMFPEFTDEFIMVYWDQLGCGINNHIIDDTFTIETFTEMTVDLIKALKKEFPRNRLILFGVSWGSILAAKAALKVPDLIDHVITYGQVLKELSLNEEAFGILDKAGLSSKARAILEEIRNKETRDLEDFKKMMPLMRKYTEGYQAKAGGKTPLWPIMRGILASPDYTWKDFKAMVVNGYQKNTSLMKELMEIDLSDVLENIQVPYSILQGSTDIITSTRAITAFVKNSGNRQLQVRIISDNGHMPSAGGMEVIMQAAVEIKQAYPQRGV